METAATVLAFIAVIVWSVVTIVRISMTRSK